jgi:hypothetical protein
MNTAAEFGFISSMRKKILLVGVRAERGYVKTLIILPMFKIEYSGNESPTSWFLINS